MNKMTLISAFALLFTGLQCFSSAVEGLPLKTLARNRIELQDHAFSLSTYKGPKKVSAYFMIGKEFPAKSLAEASGWTFNSNNSFSRGEVGVLVDPVNLHRQHKGDSEDTYGEIVFILGTAPAPKNTNRTDRQSYLIQCGHGGVHQVAAHNLGKFGKKGIMLTGPSFPQIFTAEELDELTVSMPYGALPEPAPSPKFTHTPVLPLLGAQAEADLVSASEQWFSGKNFSRGELVFAYGSQDATLGIILAEDSENNSYQVQIDSQGRYINADIKYLAKLGSAGAITQKEKK